MDDTQFDALVMLIREIANCSLKYRQAAGSPKRQRQVHERYIAATKKARPILVKK